MPDLLILSAAHPLVHVNAALNSLATLLLVLALVLIKRGHEQAHRTAMIGALAVSAAFLACYLYYHFAVRLTVRFTHEGPVRYVYYFILATHVVLAMTVPYLALRAAYLGSRSLALGAEAGQAFRAKHRRLVRWAYPIWLYVSVTGVLVYLMLYQWFPPADL
ncbi:DUF420 domain-containing protein [Botrimarina hoheduenensis]|uniref:DUF420 domain-containing protein n=1 Tax=Botrimarina hoheduenensis TaxID=2528000 RepID=A0A5C5VYP7_9BACT|nr:DUF420 domain-containing protein [Botrimarina hoheduenensis]TWT42871.1 hypothetical protein Pla111_25090 [Botrimarina hoheduenensis]